MLNNLTLIDQLQLGANSRALGFAVWRFSPLRLGFEKGDPPLPTIKEVVGRFLRIAETWGEDHTYMLDYELPSQNGNEGVNRWIVRLCRMSASPRDFRRQLESIVSLDAGDAAERIRARTLVQHVNGDRVLPVAGGRVLGSLIPGATYIRSSLLTAR